MLLGAAFTAVCVCAEGIHCVMSFPFPSRSSGTGIELGTAFGLTDHQLLGRAG